jgi:hypothetical protein
VCYVGNAGASAGCLREIDAAVATQLAPTGRLAFTPEPSAFARVQHVFVGPDIEHSVRRMRVANVAVALVALGLLGLLAPSAGSALGLALVVLAAPVGIFFVAAAHPQSWVYSLLPVGWLLADAGLSRWLATRSARWAGVGALGGALMWLAYDARPQDSWLFVGVAVLLLVVRHATAARLDRRVRVALAAVALVTLAELLRRIGGPRGVVAQFSLQGADGAWNRLTVDAAGAVRDLVAGTHALSSNDVLVPPIVGVLGVLALGVAMAAAHGGMARRAWATFGLLVGLVAYLPWRKGDIGVSGRYVWVLAAIALTYYFLECRAGGVAIAGMPRAARRVVVAAAGLANAFALHAHIRRYVTGSDVVGWNLNRDAEWWWPSGPAPMTTWLLGSAAFALAAGLLVLPERRPA